MMLTDKVWKLLEPATNIGEGLTREEIEKSLQRFKDIINYLHIKILLVL